MKSFNNAIILLTALCCLFTVSSEIHAQNIPANVAKNIQPVILVSDLMRPYDDPDDHWDLATAFALAYSGAIDLKGIIIDSPVNMAYVEKKNPDVTAVAMLNYITGLAVPVVSGSPYPLQNREDKQEYAVIQDLGGVNMIQKVLSGSDTKVKIVITGSSRDVAIALNRFPKLFEKKCSGIYLNAGFGLENPYERSRPEWNTKLDKEAFNAIFFAQCPVYWFPINISHYRLKHGNVLPYLSTNMQKFFTFMYEKRSAGNWFQFLQKPMNDSTINTISDKYRSMFCTAGLFHAAGFLVDENGNLVCTKEHESPITEFIPVGIEELKNGYVKYDTQDKHNNIRLLSIKKDKQEYEKQTEKALKYILSWMP